MRFRLTRLNRRNFALFLFCDQPMIDRVQEQIPGGGGVWGLNPSRSSIIFFFENSENISGYENG